MAYPRMTKCIGKRKGSRLIRSIGSCDRETTYLKFNLLNLLDPNNPTTPLHQRHGFKR